MLGKVVICLVGVILLTAGILVAKRRRKFFKNGEETTGVIVDYAMQMDDTWAFVYEYTTREGKKIVAAADVYRRNKQGRKRSMGKKVPIVYNSEKPTEFVVKNDYRMSAGVYGMILMGIFYCVLGIFIV